MSKLMDNVSKGLTHEYGEATYRVTSANPVCRDLAAANKEGWRPVFSNSDPTNTWLHVYFERPITKA